MGEGGGQDVGGADEIGDEAGFGLGVDLRRGADLGDFAVVEHGEAVGHRQRFVLVVGDEDEGDAKALLQGFQLVLHGLAEFEVERTEGFIQQQDFGFIDQSAGEGDALALAAGKLAGLAAAVGVEMDEGEHFLGLGIALGAGHAFDHQAVGDVVADVHVREQGVILEHRVDVAQMRRGVGDVFAEDANLARGGGFKAGDQPQAGGFAGA